MMTGEARVTDFNPRSPHGERLICVLCMFNFKRYFNPRSPHGERHVCRASSPANVNFNPRSPHGERLELVPISAAKPDFNPRSPHGERPYCLYHLALSSLFQSTLPARGATSGVVDPILNGRISIHAPRRGSDATNHGSCFPSSFQSTLPARGATWYRDATRTDEGDFNPRSPHGERHCKAPRLSPRGTFQSTLPARGATPRRVAGNRIVSISIHAPRTGSDARTSAAIPDVPISIHAPRTGSDTTADRWFAFFPAFQSTLPARGATCSGCSRPIQPEISIHAPRTGSDQRIVILPAHRNHFNPRSPHGERPGA